MGIKRLSLLLILLFTVPWANGQVLGGPDFAKPLPADKLPKSLPVKGELIEARVWREKGDPQILVLSEEKHPESLRNNLYLAQYSYHERKLQLVWSVKEFAKSLCKVEFYPKSLQIVDLDGDGRNEVGFIYIVECEREKEITAKMLLYRNGVKLAIRGTFQADTLEELEKATDPMLEKHPPIIRWFMEEEWNRYLRRLDERYPAPVAISARGNNWLYLEWDTVTEGDHRLITPEGTPWEPENEFAERIHKAFHVEAMADSTTLLYISGHRVGLFSPETGANELWLELAEDNEGISLPAWTLSRDRVAFIALNINEFPQLTRLFVFDLEGNEIVGRRHFDLPMETNSFFSSWEVSPPKFLNDSTLKVKTAGPDGMADGGEKTVDLGSSHNK